MATHGRHVAQPLRKHHELKSEDTLLSAVAGFVDTLSFVSLFGLFTAHVTGNFVLIGAGVAGYGQGLLLKLSVFPAFICGVIAASLIARSLSARPAWQGARALYAVQAVMLLGFCVAGVWATPVTQSDSLPVLVAGIVGTFAMGVQNAHPRVIARASVPNTVMTGNVTQAILDVVDLLSAGTADSARVAARARFRQDVAGDRRVCAGRNGWRARLSLHRILGAARAGWRARGTGIDVRRARHGACRAELS